MKLQYTLNQDDDYMGIVEFTLFLSSLPLIYILPLAIITFLLSHFRGNQRQLDIQNNYGSISEPANIHELSYFSSNNTSYLFITLAQIALTISSILFTLIFNPSPKENSTAMNKWFLIYLIYQIGYSVFLYSSNNVNITRKGFVFFNFLAYASLPFLLVMGFLFINGVDSQLIWALYFATFLAMSGLAAMIPFLDFISLVKWLFY
ncbi:hypothetical protein K502DRAFT_331224 [Neoconidiobolus thromboides FSU 785]|nr:hypothetical protein K502DRAFT_331224 [Neoconidiobolus thromboides FSU 785]